MITIVTNGSRGDYQPFIYLAKKLIKDGFEVQMVCGPSFKEFIENEGIKTFVLSADYKSGVVDSKTIELAQKSDNIFKMLLQFNKLKTFVNEVTFEMYQACKGSELIIYHPGTAIGYFAGKILDLPTILVTPFPLHKTKERKSIIFYGKHIVPIGLSHRLLQMLLFMASKTGIKYTLKKEGQQGVIRIKKPFELMDETHISLVNCSNYIFDRPKDWADEIYQFGYFSNQVLSYEAAKDLIEFIQEEAPVYFGFGSVFHEKEKERIVDMILEATKATNTKALISGMGKIDNLPKHAFAFDGAPHGWLFPKMKAVCHHGGAGTSAAGFMAGVPSIIVPFSNDQFGWAERSFELGIGVKPIPIKKLTTTKLIAALEQIKTSEIMDKAKLISEQIKQEKGLEDASKLVKDFIKQKSC